MFPSPTAPLIVNGRSAAFYFVYRDISDRKRAEALSSALYRIAEKASATEDLQQFFAAIHGIVDELMPARNFSIAIHDPESQLLSFPYFVDEQESAPAPAKAAPRPRRIRSPHRRAAALHSETLAATAAAP